MRPRSLARLDLLLADIGAHWPVPGGVVVVVDASGTVLTRPFGFANLDAGAVVTGEELFEIGSISKVATAIVIHQLIDEGRFGLGTPIVELLPWFNADGADRITVRNLLHHRAGLISGSDAMPDELAQALLAARSVLAPVAAHFHYSNLGYILLSLAAATVTGRTLAELVSTRVLHPLGMTDAIAAVRHEHRARLAQGYAPVHDDRPWLPGDPFAPAAFERMITALAPGGEDTLQLVGSAPADDSRYGLGINVERHGERTVLTHGGGMVGYASFVLADATEGRGVVVLTNANGDSPVAEAIARAAAAWAGGRDATTHLDPAMWQQPGAQSAAVAATDDARISLGPSWSAMSGGGAVTAAGAARPRAIEPAMLGAFEGRDAAGRELALTIRHAPVSSAGQGDADDAGGADGADNTDGAALEIESDGVTAAMNWGWGARVATTHPEFRTFAFEFESRDGLPVWTWGGVVFAAAPDAPAAGIAGAASVEAADADALRTGAYVGHYRSYSPWFTNFRVVLRSGTLVLIAATGVEAPAEDVPLVELEPGVFRIGADEWLSERLNFGPIVDGRAAWCDRDGCLYSRAFTA
ncbi:MAG TPA: serine hydrolase domain-containing protein [Microbacteriaceae bacterium]